jgi:hypothetical protein
MKLKLLTIAIVAALATGCASNKVEPVTKVENKLEQKPDVKKAEAEFLETNGTLQIQFSEEGEWLVIKTVGTAPINFNHAQGREDAFMLATMRAKRNLVEFMSNDVKSAKTAENIAKTSLRDIVKNSNTETKNRKVDPDSDDDGVTGGMASEEDRRRANRIAQSVTESMSDNSQAILRGAFVAKREVSRENNMVAVTIQVSKKSINASANLRTMMNGF